MATLTGLAQNFALLLSLTLVYSVIRPFSPRVPRVVREGVSGGLFALIAMAAMHTPFIIAPGVIADARYLPVIVAWWWRGHEPRRPALAFILLGVALDAIVLAWAAALPDRELAHRVLSAAALPVGLFLPFGTLVLGMLLVHESRRHAERERLALTQFAIERATEALFWIEADGRILNANAAATRLTGYPRDELLTKRVWELRTNGSLERWRAIWADARAGHRQVDEGWYRRRDGSDVPLETSGDFVAYGGGGGVSGFSRGVTGPPRAGE